MAEIDKLDKITGGLKIIAATRDYLVVEKPAGMLTHVTNKNEPDALAEILLRHYPELKKVGEDPTRPGIIHRLDKEASGLLVIARTNEMFEHLKSQFKKRLVDKEYLVLAHGKVAKDWGEITFPIGRSTTNPRMASNPLSANDQAKKQIGTAIRPAHTEFTVEKRFVNFTLLRVKIYTGRMHQIRVHFLAYNHPLVGDPLYFQRKRKRAWDEKLGRLFLHCAKLSFADLANNQQTFESPLPSELQQFLLLIR